MYEESELSYFKGGLAVGIGLGLLSGVASTIWYHRKRPYLRMKSCIKSKNHF